MMAWLLQALQPYHEIDPERREHLPNVPLPVAFNPWSLVWLVPGALAIGFGLNDLEQWRPGTQATLFGWVVVLMLWRIAIAVERLK